MEHEKQVLVGRLQEEEKKKFVYLFFFVVWGERVAIVVEERLVCFFNIYIQNTKQLFLCVYVYLFLLYIKLKLYIKS